MTTKIIFLVSPHSNLLDFAGAATVFYEAKDQGLQIELSYCSFEKNINSSIGVSLGNITDYKKQKVSKGDYIFILSTDIHYILSGELNPGEDLLSWLVNAYKQGVNLCSICNGAFLLGMTGLLNGKNCTTHWKRTTELQQMYPHANVVEDILFIEDKGIISSAGATSGIDVALHILSKLKGDYFTYKISRELVVYNRRSGMESQQSIFLYYRNHVHSGIHKVQDWLNENLYKKTTLFELAEIALMSPRNFTRMFKQETQLTVNEYITLLRKEKIKALMKSPDLSRAQIAKQCGLQSVRHLSRLINAN